jgi:hypothetical protein
VDHLDKHDSHKDFDAKPSKKPVRCMFQNETTDSILYSVSVTFNTSSAAQGGGGSFLNRKLIGEVGCCEPRKAERIH